MPMCAYEPSIWASISEWLKRENRSVCNEDSLPTLCGGPEAKLPHPTKAAIRTSNQSHILEPQATAISLQGGILWPEAASIPAQGQALLHSL